MKKIKFILKLIGIGLQHPSSFFKNINRRNLLTLKEALKFEREQEIENNLKNLLNSNNTLQLDLLSPKIDIPNPKIDTPSPKIDTPSPKIDTPSQNNESLKYSNEVRYLRNHTNKLRKLSSFRNSNYHNLKKCIVIIADLNLPQCKKYRVLQKVEILKKLGYTCSFAYWEDIPRCLNFLQFATTVLFYRIPNTRVTNCYIDEALRLGLKIGYDIDDPIFDEEVYANNKNLEALSKHEKKNLLKNTHIYKAFMQKCDFVITSTPGMIEVIKRHTNRPVLLWRNLIDSETLNAYTYSTETYFPTLENQKFVISYMSGSRAHEADFYQVFDALHQVLTENKEIVRLNIVGYANYGKELKKRFPNQVKILPFSDYYTYLSNYRDIDLNIIPLVQDEFNNCKSAIRMMEAALFEVPSMISSIGDFKNLIINKQNGILIKKPSNWYHQMTYYINHKQELKAIGKNAKISIEKNLTVDSYCLAFPEEIEASL